MPHKAKAFLDVPGVRAIAGFRQAAEAAGLPQRSEGADLVLTLQRGTIRISGDAHRTSVEIDAREPVGLQLLRDLLADKVEGLGLALDWQTKPGIGLPANLSLATVETVSQISPAYIRVTITGRDLERFSTGGLHFRLLLGPDGADWPTTDSGGVTQWPGGLEAWHRPVYTTRAIEPLPPAGSAQITFDVFLHDGGRVTDWARRAVPGTELALTGPGGSDLPTAGWIGIVGDETAVPVAARILASVAPGTRGTAVLFVPGAEDVQALAHPPGVDLRWVLRDTGETPVDALEKLRIPATDRFVFFAAERSEAMRARAVLGQRGLGRAEFMAAAYWTAPTDA